ncbi:hypothetical protein F5Y04DRAFT_274718 [Hypomontagnella monticulosa]|nr:hypothetical protein F5Y04DRAFT_274718 [Hypomontagnella monticulosa]
MKLSKSVFAIAIGVGMASALEKHIPTNTPGVLEETLPISGGDSHLEPRELSGAPALIVDLLCTTSEKEIRSNLADTISQYHVDELVLIKEELRWNRICDPRSPFNANIVDTYNTNPLEPETHRNVPKCVNAIMPGQTGSGASSSSPDSSATVVILEFSAAVVAFAIAAWFV